MAEPSLASVHLVAVTMPGHAGAPPPDDYSIANYARLTADLAQRVRADVVVGFSMGAAVALEMVASKGFAGPTVLLGISLSPPDEPAFFRVMIRLGNVLGTLPATILTKAVPSMVKRIPVSAQRQAELREDFGRNVPADMRRGLREYLTWLKSPEPHAQRLCRSRMPTWVVHAEKGDGGLTPGERATLQACPSVRLVTIPGSVFLLPNEVPCRMAEVISEALASLN
jgi:pimeloyl-ACP methyl ester carboxylesterase